jgi:hypothetical protein
MGWRTVLPAMDVSPVHISIGKGGLPMTESILLGRGRQILELPRKTWEQDLAQAPEHTQTRLRFMTEAHHRVRRYVVSELPKRGQAYQPAAIEPAVIAQALQLPADQVETLLDELQSNLFFLVRRNSEGAVSWAFPVTVDPTPHRLSFSTGEQCYAA